MRVFITGASGFIGRALAERFRAEGDDVRGMDLAPDAANDVVAGDVGHEGPWQRHAEGCDLVVHTAAVVSLRITGAEDVWRANVLGTKHALDAAIAGGASRLLHISSVTAFGFDFPDGVTERDPVRPTGVPYPDTKIASEQLVLQAHAEGRMASTIIRPGDVYGPRSRPWAVMPVELIKRGRLVLPDRGRGIFSPVYVDNLVDGMVAAARSDAAAGHVLTLSDGVGVTNKDFFGRYASALGKRLPTVPTPVAVLAARLAHRFGDDPDVNPRSVEYMLRRGTYSNAKARELLGWEPEVALEEGMARTLAWLRAEGLV